MLLPVPEQGVPMARVTGVGGIFLKTCDPQALAVGHQGKNFL
jgi:hypothetical protein